jgi:DNA-directed RNA polymerase subunit RPC12/RpoP
MKGIIIKILLLDIETAPNLAYVWKLWDENIGLDALIESHYMLCWAAKWLDGDEVFFSSKQSNSTANMLKGLHKLLEEADAVIHYNGKRFDIPHINREFLLNGISPPSPYRQIDLLETAKRQFRFPSNKLDYVARALGFEGKTEHTGFKLWVGCIENDKASWSKMQEYNIQDVLLLEKVYYKLRAWVKGHINFSLEATNQLVCPHCGGTHHVKRGFTQTLASTFQRYRCSDCGTWFKDNVRLNSKDYKTSEIAL